MERLGGAARHPIDVRQPRFAGRPARPRHSLARQRVNQAGLADIRTAHQRDLGKAVARQIARGGRAENEGGVDDQKGLVGRVGLVGQVKAFPYPTYLPYSTYLTQ